MDSNTTLKPGNRLLITWVNMAFENKDWYIPSIHSWDSGPWYVLYFPLLLFFIHLLFFCYFLWLEIIVCQYKCRNRYIILFYQQLLASLFQVQGGCKMLKSSKNSFSSRCNSAGSSHIKNLLPNIIVLVKPSIF